MLRARVVALSGILAVSFLSGCAESYCSDPDHQTEAMCQLLDGGTVAAFTISPSRVAFNKDSETSVTISAYSNLASMFVTLSQSSGNAQTLPLGSLTSESTLQAKILASDLADHGFTPGPAEVNIAGQKQIIRIFVAPSFDSSTFSAVHDISSDQGTGNMAAPSWIGIPGSGNKKILTLNEYAVSTIAKQAIGEYSFDPGNKALAKSSPLLFSAYNSTPYMDTSPHNIALSASDFVIPEYGNANTSLITQCSLDGTCSGSSAVQYGSISSLSVSSNDLLYAGIFNGKVLAFSDSDLIASVSINGTSASSAMPYLITVYNANDDGYPDISVWHSDGNVSIALSDSTGKSLKYAAEDSASLKNTGILGNAVPDAVAAGDIDQDGLDDFVIAKGSSLYILTNLGAGQFSKSDAIAIPNQGPAGSAMLTPVRAIAIGDVSLDSSGLPDVVLGSKTTRLIAVLENTATLR